MYYAAVYTQGDVRATPHEIRNIFSFFKVKCFIPCSIENDFSQNLEKTSSFSRKSGKDSDRFHNGVNVYDVKNLKLFTSYRLYLNEDGCNF